MRLGVMLAVLVLICPGAAFAVRRVEFAPAAGTVDAAVFAIADEADFGAVRDTLGDAAADAVVAAVTRAGFDAKEGATLAVATGTAEIHLIGVKPADMRPRDWADFGGRAAGAVKKSKAKRIAVIAPGALAGDLAEAALGARLGQYDFLKYKSDGKEKDGAFVFAGAEAAAAKRVYDGDRRHVADAALWVRDMQSEPANVLYPEEFVRRTRDLFADAPGVSIQALDVNAMRDLKMGAILGVGQGSVRPPRMLIVRYQGAPASVAPIAFAGKGITFDSGGVSIKPNDGMWRMKSDMTGAAVSVAAVAALAKMKAPVNAIGVAALAENMPDGGAIRPGDVLRARSGKTIEIMSTDAEGRLVLADALWLVQERYKPSLLVDIATLTGSVGRALGDDYAGLFTRDDKVAERLLKSGERSGEELWRLPLHNNHFEQIKSDIADIKNGAAGEPGASTAAAFLASFIKEETNWAHLDIAGVDWRDEATPTKPKGASGFGVLLLTDLARESSD
jgi:leucyl aminopeptidase